MSFYKRLSMLAIGTTIILGSNQINAEKLNPIQLDNHSNTSQHLSIQSDLFGIVGTEFTSSREEILDRLPNLQNEFAIENKVEEEKIEAEKLKQKEIKQIAENVLIGKYGNGKERIELLKKEKYELKEIQIKVKELNEIKQKEIKELEKIKELERIKKENKVDKVSRANTNLHTSRNNVIKSSSGVKASKGRQVIMEATAYSYTEPGLGYKTANGTDLRKNGRVIAVDPRIIPLGSKVTIEGYGTYIAADTGGAIKGNRIDLHFPTVSECKRFGRRKVKVTIH